VNEQKPPQSLAERALKRLRKLADGNGLDPKTIAVFDASEQSVTLHRNIFISPLCETESLAYAGAPRGKERRMKGSFAELQGAVERHKKEFLQKADWVEAVVQQLKTHETQGWGLQNAKVTLPERSVIFAASEACPDCGGQGRSLCKRCEGRGMLLCSQCQGRGREWCYHCMGKGEDPHQPAQPCHLCQGTLYVPCRFCQMRGYVPCPSCRGSKGHPCRNCGGTGSFTQEIKVTCGAQTRFSMEAGNMPSGLRKGLDRIGVSRLGNGHADIESVVLKQETEGESLENRPLMAYTATLPYAEMKVDLGGKKAVVSAIGKRCVIVGVPPFLDLSLKPWMEKLHLAASGKLPLEQALQARAIKEILSLVVSGRGGKREIQKLYPYGLSSGAVESILADLKNALKRMTLTVRTITAVACAVLAGGFFYLLFPMGLEYRLMQNAGPLASFGFGAATLAAALGASWAALNFAARFALRRRFPKNALALQQKTGKTGYALFAAVAAAFFIAIALAPVKPFWLIWLML